MSNVRGRTRKIHAEDPKDTRSTACRLPISRRYVRNGNESSRWLVNCNDCLRALVDACNYTEFLKLAGFAKIGRNGLPIRKCKGCGECDEFTSESTAHGICASCMAYANRWTP